VPTRNRIVIGISGGSGSGKTWLATQVKQLHPERVTLFGLDNYYKDVRHVSTLAFSHDNPAAIDFERAAADLWRLKRGESITIPKYDFDRHRHIGTESFESRPVIVVEGLFIYADDALCDAIDHKVWVDAPEDVRYRRRLARDTAERGRNEAEVASRYARDVRPGYAQFIAPLRAACDVVLDNSAVFEAGDASLAARVMALAARDLGGGPV